MRALILALALFAGPASAELVIALPNLTMRLQAAPCEDSEVLAHIDEQYHADFRRMVVTVNGRAERGCWIDEGETVYLKFADSSGGRMYKAAFKDSPGV